MKHKRHFKSMERKETRNKAYYGQNKAVFADTSNEKGAVNE